MLTNRSGRSALALLFVLGAASFPGPTAEARIRLVSSSEDGVVLEATTDDTRIESVSIEGRMYQRVHVSGGIVLPEPGRPEIPVWGTAVGIPYGVDVSVAVTETDFREIPDIALLPVPDETALGQGQAVRFTYREDPGIYTVSMTVTGPGGSDTVVKEGFIEVTEGDDDDDDDTGDDDDDDDDDTGDDDDDDDDACGF